MSNSSVPVEEKALERMEALLRQSANGFHVLFDNRAIAKVLKSATDEKDFFDLEKMRKVQDVMTELIARPTYDAKMSYLRGLDDLEYSMLVRTYFHIVENTVRAATTQTH